MKRPLDDIDLMKEATGVVADFSGWKGIKQGEKFKTMKITSKERVYDPYKDNPYEDNPYEDNPYKGNPHKEKDPPKTAKEQETQEASKPLEQNLPKGLQKEEPIEGRVNPVELKEVAVRLLPKILDLKSFTQDEYIRISEHAIRYAFAFLTVFDKTVEIDNGQSE